MRPPSAVSDISANEDNQTSSAYHPKSINEPLELVMSISFLFIKNILIQE